MKKNGSLPQILKIGAVVIGGLGWVLGNIVDEIYRDEIKGELKEELKAELSGKSEES